MLSPYRVVDLSNEHGILCGQILADLGADVIQIEPPGGSGARRVGPWEKDRRGPEHSLYFQAYARNKRSIVLDLDPDSPDRAHLLRLIDGADFLIESERPGDLAAVGLDYESLRARNPSLVYVSISAFGQTGPKARYHATDLTQCAASGHAWLTGEHDRPPLRVRTPQAHAHAAADAAVGALIAHFERMRSGRGQHVDASMQQAMTLATQFRTLDVPIEQVPAMRVSGGVQVGEAFLPTRYPLADGWITLGPSVLPSTGHFMRRLLEWAKTQGHHDPALDGEDWGSFALRLLQGHLPPDAWDRPDAVLRAVFAGKTKAEMIEAAVEHRLLVAPVFDIGEFVDSPQLRAREALIEHVRTGSGNTTRFPGPFARFGKAPIASQRPPPFLDEHGDELRAEAPRRPAETTAAPPAERPLEGVKILDLFWQLAGPGATRMLADYGATVVHVESTRHLDTLRVIPPYQFSFPHPEGAGAFQCANANKLGLTLDLGTDEGRAIAMELVDWADVVTESFAAGVMEAYGLHPRELLERRPDLIVISSCLLGQSGPWRAFTGFGNLAASVTGFVPLASWPDKPPSGPYGAYTDFVAARYNAVAILAALEYRRRTGEGQWIDLAQAEAALHFVAPAVLDYTVNGRSQAGAGNFDFDYAPHDAFACAGEDRWVAVAVRDDRERSALAELLGLAPDASPDALEQALREWAREREAVEVENTLQALGIPAHEALDTPGVAGCPQLAHRGHFVEVAHEIYPTTTIEGSRIVLSEARARVPASALHFGRDNRLVLETILGKSPEEIAGLAERGILL